MIRGTQKRVTSRRSLKKRGKSRREVVIGMSTKLLNREKTREASIGRGLERDRLKEDRGREVRARMLEDREIEVLAL